MKLGKFVIGFFTASQIASLKDAGHHIIEDVKTASLAAEGAVIASPVGSQIVNLIKDVKGANGTDKFAAVLKDAIPLVQSAVNDHGISLVASVENTARAVIQTLFNATVGAVVKGAASAVTGASTK